MSITTQVARVVLLTGMIAALGASAQAEQTATPPEPRKESAAGEGGRPQMQFQRLREALQELGLSDDQKTKILEIFESGKEQLMQLQNLEPQDRQAKARDALVDVREKVRGILTDEQATKLQERMANTRGQGRRFGPDSRRENKTGEPASAGGPPQAQRPGATLQRLQESLANLNLSGDQKTKAQAIFEDGKSQLNELREKMQGGNLKPDEMRTESQRIFAEMRDQLAGVLTKEQQEKLRDEIQRRYARDTTPPPPAAKPVMVKSDPMAEQKRRDDDQPAAAPAPQAALPAGPKIGDAAPDFTLERLDGRNVQLSVFKNKPTVIEFGSYSSPSFRQRAARMEELARQYGTRANFLVIYTKEAHPTGGWEVERNKDEAISVAPHADLAARQAAAKEAKQTLKITIPIAIDSIDDKVFTAYGALQNSAFVLGRDGKILAKQTWADPFRLRAALDEAIATKPSTAPAD